MCGRYALRLSTSDVRSRVEQQAHASVDSWAGEDEYNVDRGYNIPPRTRNPVVLRGGGPYSRRGGGGGGGPAASAQAENKQRENDAPRGTPPQATTPLKHVRLENMQWGLVPHWMKHPPDHASSLKTINARDDTILEGGSMWKSIRGRKRCIVLAEGFYEWLKKGNERIPHHVKRKDGHLMFLAGLWDSVTFEGEKEPLHTYTIVTTNSNKQLSFLHDRMPVILSTPEEISTWLDTSDDTWSPKVAALLKPFDGELECYVVPKEVGKVGQQSPDFLKPVAERKGNISSFFAKQAASSSKKGNTSTSRSSGNGDEANARNSPQEDQGKKVHAKEEGAECDNIQQIPLNPDEGQKVKLGSQQKTTSHASDDGPKTRTDPPGSQDTKTTVELETQGNRPNEAIVLDDDDDDDAESRGQVHNRKKRMAGKSSQTASHARKKQKKSTSPSPGKSESDSKSSGKRASTSRDNAKTDGEGNKKLENYFVIEDDDSD